MIKLRNTKKVYQVLNLPAPEGVQDTFGKDVEMRLAAEDPDGTRGTRIIEKHVHGSITILGGETSEPLPDWVKQCPEVASALARGALKLIQE